MARVVLLAVALSLVGLSHGLSKPGDFRRCADVGFCKRNRALQTKGGLGFDVDEASLRMEGHLLVGDLYSAKLDTTLEFTVSPIKDGTVRFQVRHPPGKGLRSLCRDPVRAGCTRSTASERRSPPLALCTPDSRSLPWTAL